MWVWFVLHIHVHKSTLGLCDNRNSAIIALYFHYCDNNNELFIIVITRPPLFISLNVHVSFFISKTRQSIVSMTEVICILLKI